MGPRCKPRQRGLDEKEKDQILAHHNFLRRKVLEGSIPGLPKAKSMEVLFWDNKLAEEAQRCNWIHAYKSQLEYSRPDCRWADLCPVLCHEENEFID